jgi:PKD repeat protein
VNEAPEIETITAPTSPVVVGVVVNASGTYTDNVYSSDTHTAVWDWGDGMTSLGNVDEDTDTVTGQHVYLTADVYEVTLTVTDNHNASDSETFQYISVYNPTPQALFTGASKFNSPAGAIPTQPAVVGQVQFGITAKYQNGSLMGDAEMNFNAGNIEFESTSLTVFVTANGKATLRGTGTVNGNSGYTFLVTGLDGGSGGNDFIRFQIKQGTTTIYDSGLGAPDTADPTSLVTAGQVIVH